MHHRPNGACINCWRVWLTRPRNVLGYCWHGKVAWRIRPSGEFITASGINRDRHRAFVRALNAKQPTGFAGATIQAPLY